MSIEGLNGPAGGDGVPRGYGRVLVTGGAGFIGSHLCEALLERGYEVVVADVLAHGNKIPPALRPHVELARVDVRSAQDVSRLTRGCRFVFHFASVLGVDVVAEAPVLTMETETAGVRNVAMAALEHGVERIVYASTSGVYGHSAVERTVSEDILLDPRTSYAIAKRYNEIYLKAVHEERGLESVAVRLFNVYGPRQDERMVIPRFIRQARAGQPLSVFGSGMQTRDFTEVSEVCEACIRLAEGARGMEVFNIACGREATILQLAERIVALTGSSSPIMCVEAPSKRYDFEVQRRIGSSDKLERWTGYRPTLQLDEGLRRMLDAPAADASAASPAVPAPRSDSGGGARPRVPALMIFDFDGTVVRSRDVLAQISRDVLARHGIQVPHDEVRALIGLPTAERFRRHGVPGERLDRAVAEFDRAHGEHDYGGVELIPGFRAWLDSLPQGPRWILSSAPERPVVACLERFGLADAIDRVVCRRNGARVDKVDQARRWSADGEIPGADGGIWYFGDELGDLQAAGYLGAVFHLVEDEHNRHLRFLADHVLRDFRDMPADGRDARAETELMVRYLGEARRGLDVVSLPFLSGLVDELQARVDGGGIVYLGGNGGCQSIAAHFATDLRRVFGTAGRGAPVQVLGESAGTVSAHANDLGWVTALWQEMAPVLHPRDLVLLFSTSGSSANLVEAERGARARGARVVHVTPDLLLRQPMLQVAPLVEDVLGVCCHLAARMLRRRLLLERPVAEDAIDRPASAAVPAGA